MDQALRGCLLSCRRCRHPLCHSYGRPHPHQASNISSVFLIIVILSKIFFILRGDLARLVFASEQNSFRQQIKSYSPSVYVEAFLTTPHTHTQWQPVSKSSAVRHLRETHWDFLQDFVLFGLQCQKLSRKVLLRGCRVHIPFLHAWFGVVLRPERHMEIQTQFFFCSRARILG